MRVFYLKSVSVFFVAMMIGVALLVSGCDGGKTPATSEFPETTASVQKDVLVRVQGDPVTAFDVEQAALKMLGTQQAALLDEKGQQKVLESLVLSKALARAAKEGLDAEELTMLEWKVRAYREQLLVNRYLRRHAESQPVTEQMIKEYYDTNPGRFGGRAVREYELITSRERLDGIQRERVLAELAGANTEKNWSRYVAELSKTNLPLLFLRGKTNTGVILDELQSVVDGLGVGEVSKPFFVEGKVYIARVISEKKVTPRPLSEVSADIRKALAPVQLKKAIKKISDEVLGEVNIEYVKK